MNKWIFAATAGLVSALALATGAQGAQGVRTILAPPQNGVYLGASAGPPPAARAMANLESSLGRKLLLHVIFFNKFSSVANLATEPNIRADLAAGRIPVISWGCGNGPNGAQEATLPQIAAGRRDADIDGAASAFKRDRSHLFMVRFMWEMNMNAGDPPRNPNGNNCYSPGASVAQDAQEYVAAQRHIEERFAADGVTNVTWAWCPSGAAGNVRRMGFEMLKRFYPGDAYVDWICFDAYERGKGLQATLRPFVDAFSRYGKPIMIGETGERADGSMGQGRFINELARGLQPGGFLYPSVKAVCYFDQTPERSQIPWSLTDDGISALRSIGSNAYFNPPEVTAQVSGGF